MISRNILKLAKYDVGMAAAKIKSPKFKVNEVLDKAPAGKKDDVLRALRKTAYANIGSRVIKALTSGARKVTTATKRAIGPQGRIAAKSLGTNIAKHKKTIGVGAAGAAGGYALGKNAAFEEGFYKAAKKEKSKHYVRRALLGSPISAAIGAKKGKKMQAFKESVGESAGEQLRGAGKGIVGGAVGGAAVGAAGYGAHAKGLKGKYLAKHLGKGTGKGALIGAGLGLLGGSLVGNLKGHFGSKATKIHQKYQKK